MMLDDRLLARANCHPNCRAGRWDQIARQTMAGSPCPRICLNAHECGHHRLDHIDDLPHLGEKVAGINVVEREFVPLRTQQMDQRKTVLAAAEMEGSSPVAIQGRHHMNNPAAEMPRPARPMPVPMPLAVGLLDGVEVP
jgi:hypothetical protein